MERSMASELISRAGARVMLAGWLHRFRQLGNVNFLILRDASGLAQAVVPPGALADALASLHAESVLQVRGQAVANAQAPGGVEVLAEAIDVLAPASEPPPFELHRPALRAALPAMLDAAAVSLRHPQRRALAAIAAASVRGFRETLDVHGFTEIHTPKLVAAATEGGANVFAVDYFGREAYLAQSPQFYKQTMVGVFERVYEVGPVFRAEPHDTARHLNEYVSLDAEMGFIANHHDVMRMLTATLRGMMDAVRAHAGAGLATLRLQLPDLPQTVPMLHFTDALQMIASATGEDVLNEPDLAPAHERWLGDWARREHGSDFLFVIGYPMRKRPFYTHAEPARPAHSNSFDLLFRGLELVTGGQRLHLYEDYLRALEGRDLAPYEGYLAAFRHGMPPHGGFAIGLERWTAQLAGIKNVREAALFPRDRTRLTP